MPTPGKVLEVSGLVTCFFTHAGVLRAVDGVGFAVDRGETVALVGESGSGKSVAALSIMGLIGRPAGQVVAGTIRLNGRDLLSASEREMRSLRGRAVSMIFQEPMSSLNPVHSIGAQVMEAILAHELISRAAARRRAIELLDLVRIPDPPRIFGEYPHRLSGGMRQRVMIAMAISCRPLLLIADEPTTALDVTIQAQILDLLDSLRREFGMGLLIITHDLGVVAQIADSVVVMYAGRKVEEATAARFFAAPLHPYSQGLMRSSPGMRAGRNYRDGPLDEIPGIVPSLLDLPRGCAFADRCPQRMHRCTCETPPLVRTGPSSEAACLRVKDISVVSTIG